MSEIVKVKNLYKRFQLKRGNFIDAVNGVSFSIAAGEVLGLVGESGCGKTTVGRCIARLIDPTSGEIALMGKSITRLREREFSNIRPKVQIIFQEPYESLNPRRVVKQILEEPLICEGKLDRAERRKRVKEILELIELTHEDLEKYPIQLTQGEQQRVGIGRAIATCPQILVLDEPTSLLDIHFRAESVALIKNLQKELGIACLFISHDLTVIVQVSHRIAVMYLGRIVEEGSTKAVIERPMHPYTQGLLSASLFPDPDQERGELMLRGEVTSPVNLPHNRCNFAMRCPLAKSYCYESLPELVEVEDRHFVACFETEQSPR